jgi:hypothetical protein
MARDDRSVPNSIRIFGGRTESKIWDLKVSAWKGGCRVRRTEAVELCGTKGQIVSEFRPRHRSGRIILGSVVCVAALGGLFRKCHFIAVIAASEDVSRMARQELSRRDSPAIGEEHLRTHIHASSAEPERQRSAVPSKASKEWNVRPERILITTQYDDVHPFPPKLVWAEFWAEIWRFIR